MGQYVSSDSERINVVVVHEVRVISEGLATLLADWPTLEVASALPDLNDQLQASMSGADVVLIDANGCNQDICQFIQGIHSSWERAKVVVLGVSESSENILAFIEAGASAFVAKDSSTQALVETLRMAHLGNVSCPPEISALLFERLAFLNRQVRPLEDNRVRLLTKREMEILHLVTDGLSNKEIAAQLHLELQTVKNYVHNVLEKLRVSNRREAAAYSRQLVSLSVPL